MKKSQKDKRVFDKADGLVQFDWPAKWLPRWVRNERTLSAKTIIDLKKQLDENHARAEEIISARERQIERMGLEMEELRSN